MVVTEGPFWIFWETVSGRERWPTVGRSVWGAQMVKKSGGALLLALKVDPATPRLLSTQLLVALRDMILSGGLRAGDRLPATRTIAKDLGVSRTTVVEAFERLAAEGLIVSRTGSGSFVSQALASNRPAVNATVRHSRARQKPRLARVMARGSAAFFERLPHIPRLHNSTPRL